CTCKPRVSAVTLVTQKPPVVTLRRGETATMDCNLGTVTSYSARWYKKIPGGVPQYILRNHHSWSSPSYGSGFSSPKFTSTHQSQSDYRLIISTVEERDSAVYYCQTWDDSISPETVFSSLFIGASSTMLLRVIVSPQEIRRVTLLNVPASVEELCTSNKASLVCLSTQSVPFADVSWIAAGSPVSSGISTSTAVQQPDQTFQISSYLSIQTSDWNMDKVYTCRVSLGSQTSEKTINKSHCSTVPFLVYLTPAVHKTLCLCLLYKLIADTKTSKSIKYES
uniref:Ig-like domain-containing protein n=1 Tax=Labrus bergylta TaxID=56723 RepID=A0A3Q3FKS9_9LABR